MPSCIICLIKLNKVIEELCIASVVTGTNQFHGHSTALPVITVKTMICNHWVIALEYNEE